MPIRAASRGCASPGSRKSANARAASASAASRMRCSPAPRRRPCPSTIRRQGRRHIRLRGRRAAPVIVTRLAYAVVLAWGWRRALIAFVAGAASALALAPIDAWPVLFLTFPVLVWLVDGSAAGRWAAPDGGDRRLVLRLRLFPRRPLLDRLRVPGRRQDIRLAVAVRGCRAAGLSRALHRPRARRGAADLDARADAPARARGHAHRRRVAARPSAHRLSLEHLRLRADRAAGAGAKRRAGRHLGPDVSLPSRCAPAPPCSPTTWRTRGIPGARSRVGLLVLAALAAYGAVRLAQQPTEFVERRAAAHHAAQPAAGRQIQLLRQSAGDGALSAPVRPRYRTRIPPACTTSHILIWPESAFPFFLTREPDALAQIATCSSRRPN